MIINKLFLKNFNFLPKKFALYRNYVLLLYQIFSTTPNYENRTTYVVASYCGHSFLGQ
ncbi:hypothetical protein KCTC32420_01437 [Aequorivita nionensis]